MCIRDRCIRDHHAVFNGFAHGLFRACLDEGFLDDFRCNILGDDEHAVDVTKDDIAIVDGHLTDLNGAAPLEHVGTDGGILCPCTGAEKMCIRDRPYPARAAFQVAALPKKARVEIEAVAVKR